MGREVYESMRPHDRVFMDAFHAARNFLIPRVDKSQHLARLDFMQAVGWHLAYRTEDDIFSIGFG